MLYKYIDENTVEPFIGRILRVNGRIYANPSESTLKKNGYKELVKADVETREGYYPVTTYSENELAIYEHVDYVPIEEIAEVLN